MPNATQAITDTVHRYIELVAKGSADDLVALYADDATVGDPVGGEVHSWCHCEWLATRRRSSSG